jgi:6-phosphogluconolactonase
MDKTTIEIFPDYVELSQAAAALFGKLAVDKVQAGGAFLAAISGGSTPRGMFERLAAVGLSDTIPWRGVHVFWCDERCVPPQHPESNYRAAYALWLSQVELSEANIHRMRGELPPQQAVQDYTVCLRGFASRELPYPRFDLALLGLGDDGHIASLFPGVIHEDEDSVPVMATSARYQGRPVQRLTLTPLVLNAARRVVFLVSGENKATALANALQGRRNPAAYPAQRIQPEHGQVIWMVDQPAASRLKTAT